MAIITARIAASAAHLRFLMLSPLPRYCAQERGKINRARKRFYHGLPKLALFPALAL
jgi:hypothetical protein